MGLLGLRCLAFKHSDSCCKADIPLYETTITCIFAIVGLYLLQFPHESLPTIIRLSLERNWKIFKREDGYSS